MKSRECAVCEITKPVNEFYQIKSALRNICKECIERAGGLKQMKKELEEAIRQIRIEDKEMVDRWNEVDEKRKKENKPHEASSRTLRYAIDPEFREKIKQNMVAFREKYPEKVAAWSATTFLPKYKGCQLHHWSYNPEHYEDVILMRRADHHKIHGFIKYDPETKKYRDRKSNYLLNTKKEHAIFIDLILSYY